MPLLTLLFALTVAGVTLPDPAAVATGVYAPRILLLGDSNIKTSLGAELEETLAASGWDVVRHGRSISGMARPDYFDWVSEGRDLVAQTDPAAIIIMFGGNDGQGLVPWGDLARPIKWSDEVAWRREYGRRVATLARELSRGGRQVFVLSPTNRRPKTARQRMLRILDVQRQAVSSVDSAAWIDTYTLSSSSDGSYLAHGPDNRGHVVPYRASDGIHLTRAGAAALARCLLPVLQQRGLRVTPSAIRPG